jgi:hypothetical protein
MITLDKQTISFQCPKCRFYNSIFYKQARLRDVVICRGCKINIQLDDYMNECRKAEKSIRKAFQDLEQTIKQLS